MFILTCVNIMVDHEVLLMWVEGLGELFDLSPPKKQKIPKTRGENLN